MRGWEKHLVSYGQDGDTYELWLKELEHPFAMRVVQMDDPDQTDEYEGELVTKSETDHADEFGDVPDEPEEGDPPLWAFAVSDPIITVQMTGTADAAQLQLEQKVYALFRTSLEKLAQ